MSILANCSPARWIAESTPPLPNGCAAVGSAISHLPGPSPPESCLRGILAPDTLIRGIRKSRGRKGGVVSTVARAANNEASKASAGGAARRGGKGRA